MGFVGSLFIPGQPKVIIFSFLVVLWDSTLAFIHFLHLLLILKD